MAMFMPLISLVFIVSTTSLKAVNIGHLAKKLDHTSDQSILFTRVSDGKALFAHSARKTLCPASVTKILVTAGLLKQFSPVRTLKTRLFHSGSINQGIVQGNLYVVGDGDPMLISEKLWQLAADINHLGIRQFNGDLILDTSLFDNVVRDESRLSGKDRSINAYDAPISALGINFNTLTIAVAPHSHKGKPAYASLDPYPISGVSLVNQTKTVDGTLSKIKVRRQTVKGQDRLVASGIIGKQKQKLVKLYRSVGDPLMAAGGQLRSFLGAYGISITGKTKWGKKSATSKLLIEVPSYEMRRLVQGLNFYSNNYIADVLLKRLGAEYPSRGAPLAPGSGSFANGLAVLHNFLKQDVQIHTPMTLVNGSGLSPHNRISAFQVVKVLVYMEKQFDLFPDFLASLPASGWDGTMKKRSAETLEGKVRAKTGTLSHPITVAGLAGYIRHPKHGLVAFAIIHNGKKHRPQPSILELRNQQDFMITSFLRG